MRVDILCFCLCLAAFPLGCDREAGGGGRLPATSWGQPGAIEIDEGGQSGEGQDDGPRDPVSIPFPGGATGDTSCSYEWPEPLESIETEIEEGFSAADVLDQAEGVLRATLRFDSQPADGGWRWATPLQIEPTTEEEVEIEIEYAGGGVRYHASREYCRERLDIDVRISLHTPSGALDETVDAVLMASSPTEGQIALRFHTALVELPYTDAPVAEDAPIVPVHPLAGRLSVTATNDSGRHALAFIEVSLTLSQLGRNGHVDAWMYGVDDEHLRRVPMLATIGETCDNDNGFFGFPLAPDQGPSSYDSTPPDVQTVLALLAGLNMEGVRDDGSRMAMSSGFEYISDTACGRPGDDTPLAFDAVFSFAVQLGEVGLEAHWPTALIARVDDVGALERIYVRMANDLHGGPGQLPRGANLTPDTLESDWGVTGVDVTGYDGVGIELSLSVEPTIGDATIDGELWIRGYDLSAGAPGRAGNADVLVHLRFE